MSEINECQQDIDALRNEISMLDEKLKSLMLDTQKRAQAVNQNAPLQNDTTFELPLEFKQLFERFPELQNVLSQGPTEDRSTRNESVTPTTSPRKSLNPSHKRVTKQPFRNIPEFEWVLKTQGKMEHQMFDNDVADLIDTEILSSPSKRQKLIKSASTESLKKKAQVENVYRMFGISAFPVVDPSDLKVANGTVEVTKKMLGIRLEIFNELRRRFDLPHYVLLKRSPKNESWDIFKHTLPAYVNAEQIFKSTNPGGFIMDNNEIYIFASKIYQTMLLVSRKAQLFEKLEISGKVFNLKMDLCVATVSFETPDEKLVELKLEKDEIRACSIEDNRHLEKFILGSIYCLSEKLDEMNTNLAQ